MTSIESDNIQIGANTNKSSEMWDYEAPQYCDFSDKQTFADNPEDDKFFCMF